MYTLQWALLALVPLAAMSARPGFLLETLDALQSLNKQISLQDHQYNKELPGALRAFIRLVPKAELHVHVEGTLEPELMLAMAARNGLPAPYPNAEAARAAYDTFSNLQDFLDMYYTGCSVLRTERDYYDLAMSYFKRAASNHVLHAEVFFDPQTHTGNGIPWEVFMGGLQAAADDAEARLGMSVSYIMCFRKELSVGSANEELSASLPWRRRIMAVGLDSTELGNPPSKFKQVFDRASTLGFLRVAHAGEEGPPDMVWEAIRLLHVSRVDHGVRAVEDPELMEHLRVTRLPLTVCPVSNLKLKVYDGQLEARLTQLVRSGVAVTINSDDAAYFGAYVNENYEWIAKVAKLGVADVAQLAVNSWEASFFLTNQERQGAVRRIWALAAQFSAVA